MLTGTISMHEWGEDHIVEWRIKFFTLTRDGGWYYVSPAFSFGGEIWLLRIYPNGTEYDDSTGYVDLWLWKHTDRSIKQSFSLSLKTDEGKNYNKQHCTKNFDKVNFCHPFTRFIPRSVLTSRQSDLVPDGILTVVCALKRTTSAGNATVESCTQTQKNVLREASTQTQMPILRQASIQTMKERYYNCREKLLIVVCIASIIIAVVTGCLLFYSKTPLPSSHPGRGICVFRYNREKNPITSVKKNDESKIKSRFKDSLAPAFKVEAQAVTKIQNSETNETINGFDDSGSNETGAADIKQSGGVNKTTELTLTSELIAELNKTDHSEIAGSDIPEVDVANQAGTTKTNESEAGTEITTSEINKVNNISDVVGSNEFEASGSNETGATDIKKYEDVNKTSAAEFNKTGQSEIAGADIPEVSTSNQADTAETEESEALPQPVLMVTEVGSTYLEVVWVLPEELKSNAAHIHYIVHFRQYGAQWQEVSFPDASRTSYSLTNLDPGISYQIYVMAVDSSGFHRPSETATVRTSNKVIHHNSSKDHGKQLVLYATAIIILVIAVACVYANSKTSFWVLQLYREGTQTISAEEDNIIKADRLVVADTVQPEASDSKTCSTEIEGSVSFKNLTEDYGFVTDINYLLKEKKGVDVTFELETPSGKTKFFAHQLILAVMSSYFADEFYDKGRTKGHKVISLKGINPKAFQQMIRYCYDEKPTFKTTEEACVLFKTASEFKLISLQKLCCNFFRYTKINPGNLFSILEISEEMEDKGLKDKCHKILQDKTKEIMASYELCDVTPAMVRIILDMPTLSLESEYELIKWIFDWAKVKSEHKDSCRSARDYLAELLQNMNFLDLKVEEFAILSRENPEVFNSDERATISLNIACPGSWEMPVWYNKNLKRRVFTG